MYSTCSFFKIFSFHLIYTPAPISTNSLIFLLQKTLLGELVYMADNLVFFPYTAADEPLYIIHNIDIIVSVAGSNLLQSFREVSSTTAFS